MKLDDAPFLKDIFVNSDLLYESGLIACLIDTYKAFWKDSIEAYQNLPRVEKINRTNEMSQAVYDFLELMCERHQLNSAAEVNNLYKTDLSLRGQFLTEAHNIIMILCMKKITSINPHLGRAYIGVMVQDTYLHNKSLETEPFKLKLANKIRTEKQVYAVASFYAIELALQSFQEGDINSLSKLYGDLYEFSLGPSYAAIHGTRGGKKSAIEMNLYKKRAEEIYSEQNLCKYKNLSAATDVYKILTEENIFVSLKTLETKWVPIFKKNALRS